MFTNRKGFIHDPKGKRVTKLQEKYHRLTSISDSSTIDGTEGKARDLNFRFALGLHMNSNMSISSLILYLYTLTVGQLFVSGFISPEMKRTVTEI